MAKKGFGKFVAFAAISGAVAAGVSYVLQYKIYHKELDKDFRELEEDEEAEDAFSEELLKIENVQGVSFITRIERDFGDVMNGLNSVVVVLIICASLLAFVVLYNLTNINITERKREIATLKVLGFYPRETANYVFRENIILTLIGILLGLIFGVFPHHVEV